MKKAIKIITKPNYNTGSGHQDYSGYGPHKGIKSNQRAKNRQEEKRALREYN